MDLGMAPINNEGGQVFKMQIPEAGKNAQFLIMIKAEMDPVRK